MSIFSRKKKDEAKKTDVKESVVKDIAKEEKKIEKKVSKVKGVKETRAHRILLKPVISEKATADASIGKYVFEISARANKVEVKKAVQETYNVTPVSVNIINQRGKRVRFGRHFGVTKSYKKAIVTLKKGDSIKLYEGI